MERATGIGGVFIRSSDPKALARWYADHLGIEAMAGNEESVWWQEEGPTVWAPFPADTDYFGQASQGWMMNYRVVNLDRMLDQLRAGGAEVDDRVEVMDGIGRFGWATDPQGNRFELWEPAPAALQKP